MSASYWRPLANLLRGLAHWIDPLPPWPVYPKPGDQIEIVLVRPDGPKTSVHGTVNVTTGSDDGPALSQLVLITQAKES